MPAQGGLRGFALGMTDATIRPELAKDFAGTMRALKAMGYTHFGFRLASPDPRDKAEPAAADKAAMVRDVGLKLGPVRFAVSGTAIPTRPSRQVAPPGEGMMDYAALLARLPRITGALGLVEVDNPADGMAAAAAGARFVRQAWGA